MSLEVLKTEKLHQLMSFRKTPDWDIRKFWRRFKQLQLRGEQIGIALGDAIQFEQLFRAMSLSTPQRHMVMSFLETSRTSKTVSALGDIAIKLFGAFTQEATSTSTSNRNDVEPSASSSNESDQVLTAQGKNNKKPGTESTSIRRTAQTTGIPNGRHAYVNEDQLVRQQEVRSHGSAESDSILEISRTGLPYPPGKGRSRSVSDMGNALEAPKKGVSTGTNRQARCVRFDSTDNFWRQRPYPFRKDLRMRSNGEVDNPSSFAARDQLKKTLVSITDDLLRFGNFPCSGRDAHQSNDDIPNSNNVAEPAQPNNVPDHSLFWVCSVCV